MNTFGEMKVSVRWTAPFLVLFALGCSGGENGEESYADYDISNEALSGEINGQAWTFVSGVAQDIFGDGKLWIDLYATAPDGDPCSFSAYEVDETRIILTIPPEEFDKELSLSESITLFYDEDGESWNEIVTEGRLIVDEVTDTTLSGRLYATADGSEVDGTFSVTICETDSEF